MCRRVSHVVIGVENPGDVLSQISIKHGLDVTTDINCGIGVIHRLFIYLFI